MRRHLVVVFASCLLSSCASTQVNHNAKELGESVEDIAEDQVSENLNRFLLDPSAIPSQVAVNGGTAETTDSVTPQFTFPLEPSEAVTNTVTQAATTTLTHSNTSTLGAFGLSLGGTAQWRQSWALVPVTDPDALRRLRALYRYVIGQTDSCTFFDEYPIQGKMPENDKSHDGSIKTITTRTITANNITTTITTTTTEDAPPPTPPADENQNGKAPAKAPAGGAVANAAPPAPTPDANDGKVRLRVGKKLCGAPKSYVDPAFTGYPGCVFCQEDGGKALEVNSALFQMSREAPAILDAASGSEKETCPKPISVTQSLPCWLMEIPRSQKAYNDTTEIATFGQSAFYDREIAGQRSNFHNLVMFAAEATAGGGGATGTAQGPKKSGPPVLFLFQ
jgi:hypothetical protein